MIIRNDPFEGMYDHPCSEEDLCSACHRKWVLENIWKISTTPTPTQQRSYTPSLADDLAADIVLVVVLLSGFLLFLGFLRWFF
jgi:hypothetical protein